MCAGTKVAFVVAVEPLETHRPSDIKPGDVMLDDVKPIDVKGGDVKTGDATPAGSGVPVILVALVGAAAGMVAMFAVVGARTNAADPTASHTAAPTPAAPVVDEGPVPTWSGSKRASWANDGSRTIAFTLAATHDLPVWMNRARPTLIVRCLYRATEAFVALDTSTTFEDDANLRTVRVQWDDEAQSVQRWTVSESAKELFAPDGVAFARRLATAKRLRFGFSPFNAQPVTAEFAVEGFDTLAGLVANTCGWRFDGRASS